MGLLDNSGSQQYLPLGRSEVRIRGAAQTLSVCHRGPVTDAIAQLGRVLRETGDFAGLWLIEHSYFPRSNQDASLHGRMRKVA